MQLHRDLLKLRREDATFRLQKHRGVDGTVLGPEALVLRYFGEEPSGDRLLLFNLGVDVDCSPMPEPLLAPPAGRRWEVVWSSEELRYGGAGAPSLRLEANWLLPGQSAFVLAPRCRERPGWRRAVGNALCGVPGRRGTWTCRERPLWRSLQTMAGGEER